MPTAVYGIEWIHRSRPTWRQVKVERRFDEAGVPISDPWTRALGFGEHEDFFIDLMVFGREIVAGRQWKGLTQRIQRRSDLDALWFGALSVTGERWQIPLTVQVRDEIWDAIERAKKVVPLKKGAG